MPNLDRSATVARIVTEHSVLAPRLEAFAAEASA
jgi:hypothetical protein